MNQFHGITGKDLITETLPEVEGVVNGEDILNAAQPYAGDMVAGFLRQGATPSKQAVSSTGVTHPTLAPTHTTTAPTTTTIPPNVVTNTEPEPWNPVPC